MAGKKISRKASPSPLRFERGCVVDMDGSVIDLSTMPAFVAFSEKEPTTLRSALGALWAAFRRLWRYVWNKQGRKRRQGNTATGRVIDPEAHIKMNENMRKALKILADQVKKEQAIFVKNMMDNDKAPKG